MSLKDMRILVMEASFPGCWGIGRTLEEALQKARQPKEYMAYIVHPETKVNGMAAMSYPDPNENDEYAPRLFHWKMSAKKAKIMKEEIDGVLAVAE